MATSSGFDARRSGAVSFRLAPEGSIPVRTATELEQQLRRRLRLVTSLIGAATGALGIFAVIMRREHIGENPVSLFTEPPLPGVLIVVSLGMVAMLVVMARSTSQSIRELRIIESLGVGVFAGFILLNQ
ncbi:MAG TPA: hypothetical protein VFO55_07070, partial [Gemmatimonadaceae bacterium]|nr:hypothetical protein [Gemmatimonadaceae bacterium]